MITYEKFTLANGLRVLVHHDESTPIAAFNIVYDVGAADENPEKTGFAHLFEHLMFGGSVNIPEFDKPLQAVGGTSNAFTNNDITNYYVTLPKANIETAFWLDSDRMLSLAFSEKSLEVQRQVVIEEFKQRYLNQPYGDVWLLLRPLVYTTHPYRWPTIGKEIAHIEQATLDDVKSFFTRHYNPHNAVLCVAGSLTAEEIKPLAEKWFGSIPPGEKYVRKLPAEPVQTEARSLSVTREVPFDALYKVWQMGARHSDEFYVADLISDILSRGKSSRLYNELVRERQLFSELQAYVSGERDCGLFVVSGKLHPEVRMEEAEKAILEVLDRLKEELIPARELEKVKNKVEATKVFGDMSVLDKAMELCFFELQGDAELINTEIDRYRAVQAAAIRSTSQHLFRPENCSTLYYFAKR